MTKTRRDRVDFSPGSVSVGGIVRQTSVALAQRGRRFAPIDVYGIVNFYISGWDRCPPYNNGDCTNSPPNHDTGLVWGYLLYEQQAGTPAWQFDFGESTNNPFAPVIVALVE